ncbi:MAG: alcohol dehydrogenase catalytic domain-containing protein, partial [Gammaproteobacteria bacterium]|nr:alcohol dehydrogenase catalytic domain-containing protein [Gammaproteobacteria bacterium]
AGICNTDLEIIKGFMQFEGILGHEFVGEVEESSNSSLIGKRVVCDINCACTKCQICQAGDFHHCQNRDVIGILNRNGAFTEYIIVPTSNLHTVPENVSDENSVLAEPIAAALEIIEQLQPQKNISACVIGDGKLGLIIATTLSHYGLRVTLVENTRKEKRFVKH